MKPIQQTRLTPQEGGNCYAASIASMLECELDEVPQLQPGEWNTDEGWDAYHSRMHAWLAARNLIPLRFPAQDDWKPCGYALAGVKSPRFAGFEHSVVALDGEIVWDPHPQCSGGPYEIDNWVIFQVIDPSKLAGK